MFWSRISSSGEDQIFRRGDLTVDASQSSASLAGRALALSPLLFELLAVLARNPQRLVTRRQLKASLWPYARRIDTDRRLNTAMRALRAELGDDADLPKFIQTVRGRGYRWIASKPGVRKRRWVPAWAGISAVALLGAVGLGSPAVKLQDGDLISIIRAQAAVDQWRSNPTAAGLRRATALVESAGHGDNAAVRLLKGNLALESAWDWKGAERHYRAALASDPNNADARFALAWLSSNRNDVTEAMNLIREIIGSSALGEARRAELGWLLIRLNRPQLAANACSPLPSSTVNLLACGHTAAALTGRTEDARQLALDLMRKTGADATALAAVRNADARSGYARFLDWRADHFLPDGAPLFHRAQVLADAGRRQEALAMLEESVALREPLAIKIASSPSFSPLRRDPRFRALAMKVGVPA